MVDARSLTLGYKTNMLLLTLWLQVTLFPSRLRRIFLHMNIDPFSLLCLYILPGCYQSFLVTSGSSSAVEDEGGAPTLELLTVHLVSDRNLVTMSLDTDPKDP